MSYILDALRKAEAERERGNVPSVHAQPMFPPGASHAGAGRRPPAWMVPASAAVLLLAAAGVWFGVERSGSAPSGPVSSAPLPTAPMTPAAVPPPAMVAATTPTSTSAPPSAGLAPTNAPAVATTAPTRSLDSIVAALPKPASTPAPTSVTPANDRNAPQSTLPPSTSPNALDTRSTPASPPSGAPSAPTVPAAPNDARIYALNELPDDIRHQLPLLSVGGSMYSPTAANRLLIVNGQVLHEGDRITPELVLQQIKVKAAVLVFKGYRYAINY